MSQIALPFAKGIVLLPPRIIVGGGNADAIAALRNPRGWPFGTAVLTGPARSGKSLLAGWFADSGTGEAIDDAHRIDEATLFHRWNRAQESRVPLLLVDGSGGGRSGGAGWSGWRIALPDLASRIGAAAHLAIGRPDDAMLAELIALHAQMRGLVLDEAAIAYLAERCERSHMGIERLVSVIDRLSLERKVRPTLSILKEAIGQAGATGEDQPRLL